MGEIGNAYVIKKLNNEKFQKIKLIEIPTVK